MTRGTRWCSWLRHYATSWKVAGSIADDVLGNFHWHNPSSPTMALGSTQPLTEMRNGEAPRTGRLLPPKNTSWWGKRCQTLLEDLWTIWSCRLYVFYEYYYYNIFVNVYVVLFLFNNVIYVFLLLWLCILILCSGMANLTEGFPCFFLSCTANSRVKPRKHGARPALFQIFVLFYVFFVLFYVFLCCSMYCLFCVVLCIVCVYMCTARLPPGGYPIAVKFIISYHINLVC